MARWFHSPKLLRLMVYPLLIGNFALGLVMFWVTHQAMLVLVWRLNEAGQFGRGDLGPFSYINQSVNFIWAVVLGVVALILLPVLESYYERGADSWRHLLVRFVKAAGFQLAYVVVVFLCIQLTIAAG